MSYICKADDTQCTEPHRKAKVLLHLGVHMFTAYQLETNRRPVPFSRAWTWVYVVDKVLCIVFGVRVGRLRAVGVPWDVFSSVLVKGIWFPRGGGFHKVRNPAHSRHS